MIDVVNLQRKIKIDTAIFREYVAELSASVEEGQGNTFSVAFISDRRMKELNGLFRDKDSTTDVLSFTHEPDEFENTVDGTSFIGDVVISVEQAQRQAKENNLNLENEIKQLILHGLLHLCGYDHETDNGEMNKRELALRRKLKIT
jgi:probable rRNA maturation factor